MVTNPVKAEGRYGDVTRYFLSSLRADGDWL